MIMRNDEFLTPGQLVDRWGKAVQIGTLANWRVKGRGPKFVKVGSRVLYRLVDVIEYEQANAGGAVEAAE